MNVPVSGPASPSPTPQVWTELTVEHQRRAIQLIAQLAVKLALTVATSPLTEIGHDQPNAD